MEFDSTYMYLYLYIYMLYHIASLKLLMAKSSCISLFLNTHKNLSMKLVNYISSYEYAWRVAYHKIFIPKITFLEKFSNTQNICPQ